MSGPLVADRRAGVCDSGVDKVGENGVRVCVCTCVHTRACKCVHVCERVLNPLPPTTGRRGERLCAGLARGNWLGFLERVARREDLGLAHPPPKPLWPPGLLKLPLCSMQDSPRPQAAVCRGAGREGLRGGLLRDERKVSAGCQRKYFIFRFGM